ncbi:TadE/TadG family type IV pilus assembly protein [Streptomyces sp. SAJ15]|uniref:TadE/TadG family type IV pilus assembly protein n=1 Tax=Streptomyces sp. SAJ15 TaxID=2011095 RepID=UPI001185D62F|nr:TadE/TadG family type IV pilus assembly protein [Streptomyces sp. SAJ15]
MTARRRPRRAVDRGEARTRRPGARQGGGAPRAAGFPRRWDRAARDRGMASIELIGFLPLLLVIALAGVQLGLAAYAAQQAGTAARAAARTASLDDPVSSPGAAGRAAVSGWLADDTSIDWSSCDGSAEAHATVTVRIPRLLPGIGLDEARREATMPCPADEALTGDALTGGGLADGGSTGRGSTAGGPSEAGPSDGGLSDGGLSDGGGDA